MKKFIVILGFLIFGANIVFCQENKVIKDIKIEGNKNTKQEVIFTKMNTKVGSSLDSYVLQDDLKALYSLGLFSDINIEKEDVDGGILLKIIVVEWPMVGEVKFIGNKEISDGDIKDEVTLVSGQIYNPKALKESVDKVTVLYRNKGYYLAKVDTKLDGENTDKVDISFTIKEGTKIFVEKITVQGIAVFTEKKIKKEMDTEERGFWTSGVFKEDVFKKDLEKIIELYRKEGYVNAKIISDKITPDIQKKRLYIEMTIEEGGQFKVNDVKVEVQNTSIYSVEDVFPRISLKKDDVFDKERLDRDINDIRMLYAEKGYIFAVVFPKINFDDSKGFVDISVRVSEGEVAYVERIDVDGNTKTNENVIRRELVLKESEPFDSSKMKRSRERLYNLGFFEDVSYDTLPGAKEGRQIVVFKVKERPTAMAQIGAGYSSLDGLTGYIQITENNLFGNGQRISILWEFGEKKRNYELTFFEPYLFGTETSFGTSIYDLMRSYYEDYKDERIGGYLRFGRPIGEYTKGWLTYRYEQIKIFDVSSTASDTIKQAEGTDVTSSLTAEYIEDTRDSIFFDTAKGHKYSLSAQYAGGILQGDNSFTKYIVDTSWYLKTFWKFVLAFHINVGYVTGFGSTPGVPIYERFYMGGTDTVRGYDERRIGPADKNGVPTGGRFVSFGNLEYRFPIIGPLMGVTFADTGAAWDSTEEAKFSDFSSGAGLGIRFVITGAMMLRLDYGYGFNEKLSVPGGRIHFNIGNIF